MTSKYDNSQNLLMIACGYGIHSNMFDFLKPIEILKLKESLCGESETFIKRCIEKLKKSLCCKSETFIRDHRFEYHRSYIKRYIDEALRFKLLNFLKLFDKKTFNELFDNGVMYYDCYFHCYAKQCDSKKLYRNLVQGAENSKSFWIIPFLSGGTIPGEHLQLYTTRDKIVRIAEILDDAGYEIKTHIGHPYGYTCRGIVLKRENLCKLGSGDIHNGHAYMQITFECERQQQTYTREVNIVNLIQSVGIAHNCIHVCIQIISPEFVSEIGGGDLNGVYITKNELEVLSRIALDKRSE